MRQTDSAATALSFLSEALTGKYVARFPLAPDRIMESEFHNYAPAGITQLFGLCPRHTVSLHSPFRLDYDSHDPVGSQSSVTEG